MRYLAMIFVVAPAGCAHATAFGVDGAPELEPVPAESVRVYESEADLPCDAEPLARLEGTGGAYASREKVVGAMVEEAARVGADAVLLTGYSGTSFGAKLISGDKDAQGRGVAVRLAC